MGLLPVRPRNTVRKRSNVDRFTDDNECNAVRENNRNKFFADRQKRIKKKKKERNLLPCFDLPYLCTP